MAFCRNCGKEVNEDAKFCGSCGTARDTAVSAPVITSNVNLDDVELDEPDVDGLSDVWVWLLAFVPLFGTIAEIIVLSVINDNVEWIGTAIFICFNILFMTLDLKELNLRRFPTDGWGWLGYLFVPVYLFMRAAKTNRKYGYAILWCVLFGVFVIIPPMLEGDDDGYTLYSGEVSRETLSETVQKSIIETWTENGLRDINIIVPLMLIRGNGNVYVGAITASFNGHEAETMRVIVIYDGKVMQWKIE